MNGIITCICRDRQEQNVKELWNVSCSNQVEVAVEENRKDKKDNELKNQEEVDVQDN